MKRSFKKSVLALVLVLGVGVLPAPALAIRKVAPGAVPAGAVKLGNSYSGTWGKKLVSVNNLSCWPVNGKHIPGEQLGTTNKSGSKWTGIYFLSYTQRAKNAATAAKKAKGAKKKALLAEAKNYTAKSIEKTPFCMKWDAPAFDVSGAQAVGLLSAKVTKASAGPVVDRVRVFALYETWGSNLVAVDAEGGIADALTTGSMDIGSVHSAPNGKVYVRLNTPQYLTTDGLWQSLRDNKGCVLAEVVVATGNLTCVDETLKQALDTRGVGTRQLGGQFVQFDNSDGIYYTGIAQSDGKEPQKFVLRRSNSAGKVDLINDQIALVDFLVLGDGSVLVSGTSSATSAQWTRRINPSGSLSGLLSKTCSLRKFPDGNIFGYCGNAWYRYDAASNAMVDASLPGVTALTILGALSDGSVVSASNSVFSRAYPTQSTIATSQVTTVQTARITNDMILVSGLKGGKNITTVINAMTGVETVLLASSPDEYEIYHFGDISTATSNVIVDGLRFSDNKYFTGRLNVTTGAFAVSLTGLGKFADFQFIQ